MPRDKLYPMPFVNLKKRKKEDKYQFKLPCQSCETVSFKNIQLFYPTSIVIVPLKEFISKAKEQKKHSALKFPI
jgi:hypothetical protein